MPTEYDKKSNPIIKIRIWSLLAERLFPISSQQPPGCSGTTLPVNMITDDIRIVIQYGIMKLTEIILLVTMVRAAARVIIIRFFFIPRRMFQHTQCIPLQLNFNPIFQNLVWQKLMG